MHKTRPHDAAQPLRILSSVAIFQDGAGVQTGDVWRTKLNVEGNEEIRITLVWYEPTPSVFVASQLVNNLDLEVSGIASNDTETWTRPLVGHDNTINVERIIIPQPDRSA